MRRRTSLWLLAAGALLVVALGLRSSDQGKIEKGLGLAAQGMGQGPVAARRAVESWVDVNVRLELAGVTEDLARDELAKRAEQFAREHGRVVIDVTNLDVRVRDMHASANGVLVISDSQVGDLHAEERPFSANLVERGGWRAETLIIGVPRKHVPEARP